MRIAVIDPSLFTLPYDRGLVGGLVQGGHEVLLFGRQPGPDDSDAGDIELDPLFYRVADRSVARRLPKLVRLGLKGVDHIVSMLLLRRALERWQPDIVHFQWLPLPMVDRHMLPRLRRLAPLLLTVHDTTPFNGDPSARLQQRGFFAGLAKFDRVIVHTEQGRTRILNAGVPAERLSVLPHGPLMAVPAARPNPMSGEITFLLFGKIKPYKGLDLLIEAFANLAPELRRQARIRVVGKPYIDLEPLQRQATQAGIAKHLIIEARFIADSERGDLFQPNTVAVFPYREIEASGVLSIALAHGCPIIASALGSFVEVIHNGEEGLLVPPGDALALSTAMARMIADRNFLAQCAAAARRSAEAIPGWKNIAQDTAALYERTIEEARG